VRAVPDWPMQLPRQLCGNASTVAAACCRQVTQFLHGGPWIDPDAELIAAHDAPGLILLNGPSPLLCDDHVHAYAPFWELGKAIDSGLIAFPVASRAFDAAIAEPWGLLGLLSQACYRWLDDPVHAGQFFAAMIERWSELDAAGPRYTMGARTGARLWELPHLLKHVLARRGVAQGELVKPLPPGGLVGLADIATAS
jgi:hypothetical protein